MSTIKEIWCMPHSHLDVGYTHPQPLLLELQSEYIDQAIDICLRTADYPEESRFCWTIEANYVLKRWMETAEPERISLLKELIREKRICVTAFPMHTTPGCDLNEMVHMVAGLDALREETGADIKVAINHDVNGEPWTLGQVMLDSGVDFYLTGINIHFGGIPFARPASFLWEQSDGRKLRSFIGEHYSLFSQFMFTQEHSTERMQEGVEEYVTRLTKNGYQKDFAFLTATNPPLYDNNCPDLELPDLIRKYNEEGHEQKIRIVTADMLREKIMQEAEESLPVHRGDWTDYWNFGSASTARETRVSRLAKQALQEAEVIECFNGEAKPQYRRVKEEAYRNSLLFDEHTWGASQSVKEPDSPETYSQLVHKVEMAYKAADLAGYALSHQMEKLCDNPHQSNGLEGIVVVNASDSVQTTEVTYPESYGEDFRQLSALRSKSYVPYLNNSEEMLSGELLTLQPFSYRVLPFEELKERKKESDDKAQAYSVENDGIKTPYYEVGIDEKGGIRRLTTLQTGQQILNEESEYGLFDPVRETIDETKNPAVRATLFPRDVELGNRSISQWNHDWKSLHTAAVCTDRKILREQYRVTLVRELTLPGTEKMEQKITFYTYKPEIDMTVKFIKQPVYEPESLYFTVPLKMKEGWECSYDTAGEIVRLDEEQMGNVCRDWVTVDSGISIHEPGCCVSLFCPDAPMVQPGGFFFGRESHRIARKENPLLLAWALNNYWDTNFMANQSGRMEFSYQLTCSDRFEAKAFLEEGIRSKKPCLIGVAVSAQAKEEAFLSATGETKVLHVYPAAEKDAMNVLLKNPCDREDTCTLEFPLFEIAEAEIVTPQEKTIETVGTENHRVCVKVPARSFKLVRIKKK